VHKRLFLPIFLAVSILINVLCITAISRNQGVVNQNQTSQDLQKKYPLLSRRILSEFPQDILINFLDLRSDIRTKIASYDGSKFGVYFEYLPTGTSIGVNDRNEFNAASLFKLPVVMTYYHWKERTNNTDDPLIEIQENQIDQEFGNLWKKGAGHKIRLSEAVNLMLIESDNTAARVVIDTLEDERDFNEVYEGLDIEIKTDNQGAILTAKNYSSILKALYFSSVLSMDNSHLILDLLTKTKFPDKLAAGVPDDIPVAHKIGNFVNEDGTEEAFSDCGIVYVPRRPYVLCMVSVSDEETARMRMREISKTVYEYVSSK
jgi:beta-lactamase class A